MNASTEPSNKANSRLRIGLALGGGGARGLAHLPILDVFDQRGIRPAHISGTSAGAIVGALYASGMPAARIREWADSRIIAKEDKLGDILRKKHALKAIEFFDLSFDPSGLIKGERFLEVLGDALGVTTFEELQIPLSIVTSDFWSSEQVILNSGPILPAIRASMSLPGVFTPVQHQGRILVDGGGVNPVPHDILTDCDRVVAIDVMGNPGESNPEESPKLFRSVIGMFDIMQNTIIRQRREANPPDLYLKPDIRGCDVLEFNKANSVYAKGEASALELERWLDSLTQ